MQNQLARGAANDGADEERLHVAAGRNSFRYWFQLCQRIPLKNAFGEDGNLDFPVMTPLQDRLEAALEQQQADKVPMRTLACKVRQDGSSRFHMCRAYWMGRNHPIEVAVIADDKNTTPRLLNMWEVAHQQDRFGDHRWGNTAACVGFPRKFSHGTTLFEETANDPRAGQGGTPQVLISSETAHYRSSGKSTGETVFQSIANSVPDLPGTWMALESTANGKQGVYYKTYLKAVTLAQWQNGLRGNGFIKCFSAWFENRDYDDTHRTTEREAGEIMATLTEREVSLIERYGPQNITPGRLGWRRRKLAEPHFSGDEEKFDQEYPHSMDSAFVSSGTQVFDHAGLEVMATQVNTGAGPQTGKIENGVFVQTGLMEAWLRLWEVPIPGCSYLLHADFMEGEQSAGDRKQDCHAVGVIRAAYVDPSGGMHKARLVAAIKPECRVNIDVLIGWIADVHRMYGECLVVPEVNSAFGVIALLNAAGAHNLWTRTESEEQRRIGEGKQLRKRGWLTTEPLREQIIANLQRYVREREIEIGCPRLLEELQNFITKANGRKEAAGGHHDDWVMSFAIGVQCLPAATRFAHRVPVVEIAEGNHKPQGDWGAGGKTWGRGGGGKDEAWG
jgi:hypothetical protein